MVSLKKIQQTLRFWYDFLHEFGGCGGPSRCKTFGVYFSEKKWLGRPKRLIKCGVDGILQKKWGTKRSDRWVLALTAFLDSENSGNQKLQVNSLLNCLEHMIAEQLNSLRLRLVAFCFTGICLNKCRTWRTLFVLVFWRRNVWKMETVFVWKNPHYWKNENNQFPPSPSVCSIFWCLRLCLPLFVLPMTGNPVKCKEILSWHTVFLNLVRPEVMSKNIPSKLWFANNLGF